jgi:hypothetical protein
MSGCSASNTLLPVSENTMNDLWSMLALLQHAHYAQILNVEAY